MSIKLKSLWIEEYKNLKDFTIDFSKSNITCLIGNNGSGKSNVLEVISLILYINYNKILNNEKLTNNIFELLNINENFNYNLVYKLGKEFKLKDSSSFIKDKTTLPNKLIICYSGEKVFQEFLYRRSLEENRNYIKDDKNLNLDIVYINKNFLEFFELLNTYKKHLYNEDTKMLELNFKSGHNLESKNLKIKNLKENEYTKFSNLIIKETLYIATLDDIVSKLYKNKYPSKSRIEKSSKVRFFIDLLLKSYYADYIDYRFIKIDDQNSHINYFSEGEIKKILIEGINDYIADDNSIVLLDEPDAHINISKKVDLLQTIRDIKCPVMMTTHSATIANELNDDEFYFIRDGKIDNSIKDKVNTLTDGYMSMGKAMTFLNSSKDLLFVEGSSDKKAILEYVKKSGIEDFNFDIVQFNGVGNLDNFYDDFIKIDNRDNLKIILLDNDSAGINTLIKMSKVSKHYEKEKEILKKKAIKDIDKDNLVEIDTKEEIKKGIVDKSFLCLDDNKNIYITRYSTEDKIKVMEDLFSQDIKDKALEDSITTTKKGSVSEYTKNLQDSVKKYIYRKCKDFVKEDFEHFHKLFDLIKEIKEDYEKNKKTT